MTDFIKGMGYIPKSFSVFITHSSMRIYPLIPIFITFLVIVFGIYYGFGAFTELFNSATLEFISILYGYIMPSWSSGIFIKTTLEF